MTDDLCPCRVLSDEKLAFSACCGPYLSRAKPAPTAEALMRSRYSAFVKGEIDYLHDTLAPDQRKDFSRESTEDWAKKSEWLGLEIIATEQGLETDTTGTVTFNAHFARDGKPLVRKEKSLFKRQGPENSWFFADEIAIKHAPVVLGPQPGRNDPCPCGSGKKYKKCCGAAA